MSEKVIFNAELVNQKMKAIIADAVEQKTQAANLARIVKEKAEQTQSVPLDFIADADLGLATGMDDVLAKLDQLSGCVRQYADKIAVYEHDNQGLEV